ncbi:MAG: T9SS type A sorting domain-containing protein [Bacteroidales bacterium]|nr:T9SS type A sorting domain-containing protein [Bacteroidales bacterium]
MKMRKIILSIISILALSSIGVASTFYIDPVNGDNATGNGSLETPWRTLAYVINSNLIESMSYVIPYDPEDSQLIIKNLGAPIKAGDIIMLYGGLHGKISLTNYVNNTVITIKAIPGEVPIIESIHLQAGKNWKIEGLHISSEPYSYYLNNQLVFLESHSWQGPVSDIEIKDCMIYSAQIPWQNPTDWISNASDGIYIKGDNIRIINNALTNVRFGVIMKGAHIDIINNSIINFSSDAIRLVGPNNIIEGNLIKNCYAVDDNHDDGIQAFTTGGLNVDNNTIRKNIIINYEDINQPLLGDLQGIACFDGPISNWLIENNLVIVNHWHGISLYGAVNCSIINNTILDPTPDISPGPSWIKIEDDGANISSDCVVKNNISNTISVSNSTITGNNLSVSNYADYGSHFMDYVNDDFHLNQSSSAIDNADGGIAPFEDLEGNPRPSGSGYDIGAYEYISPQSINRFDDNKNIIIYPNPFVDVVIIQGDIINANIKIIDISGSILYDYNVIKTPSSIDLKDLKSGVYTLMIIDGLTSKKYSYKIIRK